MIEAIKNLWETTGLFQFESTELMIKTLIMYVIVGVLVYLAVVKGFEPLLLLPIATGMLLANLPGANLFHMEWFVDGVPVMRDGIEVMSTKLSDVVSYAVGNGGLLDILYLGVKLGIYPSLIFLGVGAMTDFSPLISNPKSIFLGGAAQLGVFMAFFGALLFGFSPQVASAIGIIGGADGPTAIYLTSKLASHLLAPIALAAYSYMALIPLIQPPIMKALTTKKEREVKMTQLRKVTKTEKIIFPVIVLVLVALILPSVAPLLGMFMLGNLFRECGVVDRLSDVAQNALNNIIVILLGVTVGATANGQSFLQVQTLKIVALGLIAFCFSTVGGVLLGKLLYLVTGGKINPLIGAAGVSAVPMAARVAQNEGRKYNPTNFLLMHAMGPNVAGVIGSAVAAGFLLIMFQ